MLEWSDVNIKVINTKKHSKSKYFEIIRNSSGSVQKGEILSLMGPSGGGKTTLLNALSGNIPPGSLTQGTILYQDRCRDEGWLNKIGFVNQDDIVHEKLTVRETIKYSALFRSLNTQCEPITNNLSDESISKFKSMLYNPVIDIKVNKILNDLQLIACSNNLMSRVSGGERKRVMIGIELISDPEVLFLDEPTSGLDTLTALKILKILKDLAINHNKIIVMTIHQPSLEIFLLIDKVILLHSGNIMFNGKTKDVEAHFQKLGLKKRDLITVPEFIIEICGDEFKEQNSHMFYGEESIFKDESSNFDPKILVSKNEFRVNFQFNIYHTFLLLKKRFQIETASKFEFLKMLLAKIGPQMCLVLIICFLFNKFLKNPHTVGDIISDFLSLESAQFYNPKTDYSLIIAMLRGFCSTLVLYMCFFNQTNSSSSCIINELDVVRKEMSVNSYSTTSLYVSTLIYFILCELLNAFIYIITFYFLAPGILSFRFMLLYIISPFATIPCGLFIAALTGSKNLNKIISGIACGLFSINPSMISKFITNFGKNRKTGSLNLFGKLTFFTFFIPPFHVSSILTNCLYEDYDKSKTSPIFYSLCQQFTDIKSKPVYDYICGIEFSDNQIFWITIISIFMYIFAGIFLMGFLTKPHLRYRLQKDHTKKNQ